jgi:hypothetical protein
MKKQSKNLMDFKINNDNITVKRSFQNKFEPQSSQAIYSNVYGSKQRQIR